MKITMLGSVILVAAVFASPAADAGEREKISRCKTTDSACVRFENLVQAEQYGQVVKELDPSAQYSAGARQFIGQAYLGLAASETNTPEQEEAYCRKAIEVGAVQGYMGLYFIHAQKDGEKALGFLRQYVATKPGDSVPYVILGESELNKKNYRQADLYLREAKRVSSAHSSRVDWMLFQANYLLGNYAFAGEMFESALANGKFEQEVKELSTDERFQGIEKRPEFRKLLTATRAES